MFGVVTDVPVEFEEYKSNPNNTTPRLYDLFPVDPIFLALICFGITVATLVIWLFLDLICHIIEVITACMW